MFFFVFHHHQRQTGMDATAFARCRVGCRYQLLKEGSCHQSPNSVVVVVVVVVVVDHHHLFQLLDS